MKARIVYAAQETNPGKILKLDKLQAAYRSYVESCINQMIQDKRSKVLPADRRSYFPKSSDLSSQIVKNAQNHASTMVETWVKSRYQQRLKKVIRVQTNLSDHQRMELRCIGKYQLKTAGKFGKGTISQEMVDLYWNWVWDPDIAGNPPSVSENCPMWMSEMTCGFGPSENSSYFGWWIKVSSLENGKRIKIPLEYNPFLKSVEGLAKSVLVQKRNNRWTFQFCEKEPKEDNSEEVETEGFDGSRGKVGVDVGLNVIAAVSDGTLYGKGFKPKFDRLYNKVKELRANRQRQELRQDSKRLARLETRLSGLTKTVTGTIANKLVKRYAGFTFVIEDLDLRGCRGQKRFAYRSLHNALNRKAKVEVVNPAYSSQMCPSCGYISRSNRSGVKFICRCCGRKSHADVVGGINLLGRSEDKQVNSAENTSEARSILRERYLRKRNSSLGYLEVNEPKPNGRKLTIGRTRMSTCIASNRVCKTTSYIS